MRVTFLAHSGFFLELETASLLFDWWKGALPPLPADRPLLVFLCQVGTKKFLRFYKPFIGGQPPVNGLLHLY